MLAPVCGPVERFFELEITNILKSSGWELEQSELAWEQNVYIRRCVSYRTTGPAKFQWSALQIG